MSRRLPTTEVQFLLAQMERRMIEVEHVGFVMLVDGKPQMVSHCSKDPDARWGRARRGYGKGYKIHAIYGSGNMPLAWDVEPLNVAETPVAIRLLPALDRGGGYVVGDRGYDSNQLHDAALEAGYQLVTKKLRPGKGLGHCRHSPGRLHCFALLQRKFGRALIAFRESVERQFAWLGNHGSGLEPLPNWARRIHRVREWIQAKLLIHAMYMYLNHTHRPLATE